MEGFSITQDAARPSDGTALGIDASSWISWAAYSAGVALALDRQMVTDLMTFGPGSQVLLVAVAGFFAAVIAIQRHMALALSANTFGSPQQLVTTGVFRRSRNPIYVAFLLPIGSLAWFSPFAAFAAALLYLWSMTVLVIRREEAVLEAGFGEAYRAYRERTPRWI